MRKNDIGQSLQRRRAVYYNMTGRTEADCKAIREMIAQKIEMTVDKMGRFYNEGGSI